MQNAQQNHLSSLALSVNFNAQNEPLSHENGLLSASFHERSVPSLGPTLTTAIAQRHIAGLSLTDLLRSKPAMVQLFCGIFPCKPTRQKESSHLSFEGVGSHRHDIELCNTFFINRTGCCKLYRRLCVERHDNSPLLRGL